MNMPKVLVIGESCKDVFVYCNANRLCPDIPVPVLNIIRNTENAGMAKNVEQNLKKLNVNCDILTNENWEQITKTRYMHEESNHMFVRVDSDHSLIPALDCKKIDFKKYELIAISDYDKGFIKNDDIEYICQNHPNVFIDTKKKIGDWISNAKFIKINKNEFKRSKDLIHPNLLKKIICTLGEEGCVFNGEKFSSKKSDVKDVSGAGDAFFAALICEFLKSSDIELAIKFANLCAGEVVKHRGVTTINLDF